MWTHVLGTAIMAIKMIRKMVAGLMTAETPNRLVRGLTHQVSRNLLGKVHIVELVSLRVDS